MHLRVAFTSTARATTRGRGVARGSSSWLRTAKSDLVASRTAAVASTHIRSYATPAKAPAREVSQEEEDSARVWRSIEDLDEDYDPSWDTEMPENEFEDYGWNPEDFGGGFNWAPPNRSYEKFEPVSEEPSGKSKRASEPVSVAQAIEVPSTAATAAPVFNPKKDNLAYAKFKIGTVQTPKQLRENIVSVLKGYPKPWLRRDAEMLSEALRARTTEPIRKTTPDEDEPQTLLSEADRSRVKVDVPPIQYNKNQTMAYVAHRIPGIYACNYRVLDEIKRRMPGFAPKRMLDFGSGPGTTTWAASQVFPSIKRYVLVEPSDAMVAVSTKILEEFPVERRRFLHQGTTAPVDIIVASYSLSELSNDATRRAHVRSMWEMLNPGGVLVMIEAGTPIGFKVIRGARSSILELREGNEQLDPNVVAPCPHNNACGQPAESWCHFIQRVERTDILRSSKKASMNWENEKFSYVAIVKGSRPALPLPEESPNVGLPEARLTRQPIKRGGHVILDACMPTGAINRRTVTRSDGRDLYKSARKSAWGDVFFFDRMPAKKDPKDKRRFWWSEEVRGKRRGTFMKEQNKKERMDDAMKQLNEIRDEMAAAIGRLPDAAPQKNMRMDEKQAPREQSKRRGSGRGTSVDQTASNI